MVNDLDTSLGNSIGESESRTLAGEEQARRPWGFWATVGLSLAVFAVYLVLQGIVIAGFALAESPRNSGVSARLIADLESNGLCLSVATLVSGPCCVGLVILFAWLRRGYPVTEYLGLQMPTRSVVRKWVLALAGFIFITDTLTYLLGRPIVPEFMVNVYETAHFTPLLYLALIVMAPVFEEVFIRGFLLAGIRHSPLGATGAVLLTALAWSGIHLQL